jgi:putative transposase
MSRPRRVLPGTTYLVTRRCVERRFLLMPTPLVNAVFLYCVAVAASLTGVKIHAFCVLSNHFHLVVTDSAGQLPRFMQWLDGTVARCLNAYYDRADYFWDSSKYNCVDLCDAHVLLKEMVYTLTNPVAAGLVPEGVEWPGLRSGTLAGGPQTITVRRPDFFFQKDGKLPEEIQLVVELPEALAELQGGPSGTLLHDTVLEKEREIREDFRRQGRQFLGRERLLLQKYTDTPSTPAPRGKLNPRVAAGDKNLRIALLRALAGFIKEYREAFEKFKAGVRDVIFPAGTYWLRVNCGVLCHDPPAA